MLPLRGASMDLLGTNMSDENLVQDMLTNKSDYSKSRTGLSTDWVRKTLIYSCESQRLYFR